MKKMKYNCIRLAFLASLVIFSLTLSPVNSISTNANEEVKQEGGDGSCSSLSDGHCLNDDTSYNVDTDGIDNVDESHLQNL